MTVRVSSGAWSSCVTRLRTPLAYPQRAKPVPPPHLPRWRVQTFGHQQVAVLEGGMPGWEKLGYPVDTCVPAVAPTRGGDAALSVTAATRW